MLDVGVGLDPTDAGNNVGSIFDQVKGIIRTTGQAVRDVVDEVKGRPLNTDRQRSANLGLLIVAGALIVFFARR